MLTKWLTNRSSRLDKKDRSFRPWLESLEERNAPGGLGPHGGDDQGGDDDEDHAPPPSVQANSSIHSNVNAHNSFNGSTITNSFNNTINNTINLMPGQTAVVGDLLGISGFLSFGNPQLGSLLDDEIALAVDNYLTSTPISAVLPGTVVGDLKIDAAALSKAIAANPLTASPIGAAIGQLAYNVTATALVTAQPTI